MLVRHDLLAWLKRLDSNNVAALKWRSCVEAAAHVTHIFHETTVAEKVTSAVDPHDFHRHISYEKAIFSSSLAVDRIRRHA
jgi:hypothetical protein